MVKFQLVFESIIIILIDALAIGTAVFFSFRESYGLAISWKLIFKIVTVILTIIIII